MSVYCLLRLHIGHSVENPAFRLPKFPCTSPYPQSRHLENECHNCWTIIVAVKQLSGGYGAAYCEVIGAGPVLAPNKSGPLYA